MENMRIFDILNPFRKTENAGQEVFAAKQNDQWQIVTAADYVKTVDQLSLGLMESGIKKGDKIATILKNCPEWNFIDMALLQIGAVQVPIYPTISDTNYQFIFNDAEVKYIIVSDAAFHLRIKDVVNEVPLLDGIFSIEPVDGLRNWAELLERGEKSTRQEELEEIRASHSADEMATLIYTSGTTGNPKGVMLSHKNIMSNADATIEILKHNPVSKVLSFLPLCHVLERIMNYTYQRHGATIYYCDNLEKIGDYIRDAQPEMFTAVPRVLEKTYEKIILKGRSLKGIKKLIFFWALRVGEQYEPWGKSGLWYQFKLSLARKLVLSKWQAAFGGRLNAIVSGGASLQERIARVFWAAGFKVMEGYGLTETSPVIAVSNFLPGGVKIGTVGPALPGVELKIAEDGEILVKGPNVMLGYFKRDDLTAEIIDQEGWLHTGDIGHFEGKFLRITDRKKEIFKTSGGKYVAPQQVENKMKESPFIEQAMVVGEGKNFAAAIIIPDFAHIESWCKVKGKTYEGAEKSIKDAVIISRIEKEINEKNKQLDQIERVKKFKLMADGWNVETGELSPTMKLKRKFLTRKYALTIESLYHNEGFNAKV
ncbi:MAG: AMP-dependent synthetase/ligase [Bacteroidetes bacterium]|nr:AMP-dependent synthetase/ligase [Bacteroidota bacterium]MBU1580321.1 AMP-dependent synthetase/ligase [Bacteroidota bacterium]MBU2466065.1 AMP-dependent synthetase/ligase [Bacteroidota bacterium]MBU2558232.1 AMP-dependent synthetase/ligase [Bacteroidota bacterium]